MYYMLAPEGQYYNYSGCGNTLNANHPAVAQFIADCLRFWVTEMHIDGFRFDLGSIFTRAHSVWQTTTQEEAHSTSGFEGGASRLQLLRICLFGRRRKGLPPAMCRRRDMQSRTSMFTCG